LHFDYAIDNWDISIDAHRHNHPETHHYLMELGGNLQETASLIMKYIPKRVEWPLHVSPPCQNLSTANKKGDIKSGMRLVMWFLNLVKLCRPTSWSMEQVVAI
jgi:site-specific DNA-cytosine methylase